MQGPPSLAEKRDIDSLWQNLARIYELSRQSTRKGALIVWPEGAIPAYIPADLGSVHNEPSLPWLGDGSAFLVGGFGSDSEKKRYNTAFAVYPDGSVPAPYFKQILIPFGEYMPFSSVFPWLNSLNENAGLFSPGHEIKVFSLPDASARTDSSYTAKIAPLICYEDTVTGPARDATRRGAELLVNLTYDTWFGRSAAPYQHHLIAIFRAIENRRFLIRSTYTGYTAVVNPLGKTIAAHPGLFGRQAHRRCHADELSKQLHELCRRAAVVGAFGLERGEHRRRGGGSNQQAAERSDGLGSRCS